MKIEDIELCATYWTVSGAVYPGAPSEVSPFPLKDRAEVSGRVGWRGMGFVLDDMEASIAQLRPAHRAPHLLRQRHPPRRARVPGATGISTARSAAPPTRCTTGCSRSAPSSASSKIKVGGGVFEEGEPDFPAMRAALATLCERAAPLGIDIVIEFLPFASINTIDRGLASSTGSA